MLSLYPVIHILRGFDIRLYQVQQCRTPSTTAAYHLHRRDRVTMALSVSKFNNVELHRPTVRTSVSNVELHRLSKLTRPVFSLEIAVELRHGELSSCAIHTLNTCNLTSTRPRAESDSKKK